MRITSLKGMLISLKYHNEYIQCLKKITNNIWLSTEGSFALNIFLFPMAVLRVSCGRGNKAVPLPSAI